jgi:hypothetical protein
MNNKRLPPYRLISIIIMLGNAMAAGHYIEDLGLCLRITQCNVALPLHNPA